MVDSKFTFQNAVHKPDMHITNEEFFKQSNCMYFTDEVQVKQIDDMRFVNEFQVLKSIGSGSFSKVKKVIRRSVSKPSQADGLQEEDEDDVEIAEFAMKIMHKPTLKRERAIRYDTAGEM
jgi:serine/threonine protein kinase